MAGPDMQMCLVFRRYGTGCFLLYNTGAEVGTY